MSLMDILGYRTLNLVKSENALFCMHIYMYASVCIRAISYKYHRQKQPGQSFTAQQERHGSLQMK